MNKKITLPDLPYPTDALEPVISKKIMELHHDKHHLAYVNGANEAMEKLASDQEIDIRAVLRDLSFNFNGHLLHSIFWQNMRPARDNNRPSSKLATLIEENFGSWESFQKQFSQAAVGVEGSGWAVVTRGDNNRMLIGQIEKHNMLGIINQKPILVCDVWEHAYYLDYFNDRRMYVEKWWSLVNWEDVEKNY